jgi:hydroxymethylpyrimidine/phosphomethylpyrimidine kinase
MSDPTGAGGVLADALACASMGCHAACAITGVVVQDSRSVEDVMVLDDEWLEDQARAVLQDMQVAAFKVGAPGSADNAQAIAEILADYADLPVVFDPFVADAGAQAGFDPDLIGAIRELSLPQTTVLTVRLAQALAGGFRPSMGAAMPDRLFWANDDAAEANDDGER